MPSATVYLVAHAHASSYANQGHKLFAPIYRSCSFLVAETLSLTTQKCVIMIITSPCSENEQIVFHVTCHPLIQRVKHEYVKNIPHFQYPCLRFFTGRAQRSACDTNQILSQYFSNHIWSNRDVAAQDPADPHTSKCNPPQS